MGVGGVAIFKNTAWQSYIMQRQDGVKKSSFCQHRTFCYFFTKQKCKKQGEFLTTFRQTALLHSLQIEVSSHISRLKIL